MASGDRWLNIFFNSSNHKIYAKKVRCLQHANVGKHIVKGI